MTASPHCFRCKRTPSQIEEYQMGKFWEEGDFDSPDEYVRSQEGTYNSDTDRFACTECYLAIGGPSTPSGWKAP